MSQLLSVGCRRDLLAMRDLGPLLELILLCLFSVQIKLSKALLHPVLKCVVFHADSNTMVLWGGVWSPLLGLVMISSILVNSLLAELCTDWLWQSGLPGGSGTGRNMIGNLMTRRSGVELYE